jgi:hypothetical protein
MAAKGRRMPPAGFYLDFVDTTCQYNPKVAEMTKTVRKRPFPTQGHTSYGKNGFYSD